MSIREFNGDLLNSDCDIICHQVNCMGVMGGGIALQIKKKWPNVFKVYKKECMSQTYGGQLLGTAQLIQIQSNPDKYIANCFGQYNYGTNQVQTNYSALKFSLIKVLSRAKLLHCKTIGIPYKIGCGLAGGDWNKVYDIIKEIFECEDFEVQIWRF